MLEKFKKKNADMRSDFMSSDEIKLVGDLLSRIEQCRGAMGDLYTRMEDEQEAYGSTQPLKENHPNSRVNITNANTEGQLCAIVEQNLAVTTRGIGPSDQPFAKKGRIALEWMLRENRINRLRDRHDRRFILFGNAWYKIHWDKDAADGFGMPVITCPSMTETFVDQKIADPLNLQDADYIAEVMLRTKAWAVKTYGDMADNIHFGGSDRATIFQKETTYDSEDAFWLIQCWTKTDGILRLIEFSDDGVLLDDSFKKWNGKKFEDLKNPKPFYRHNKYPYFLDGLYYEEGELYAFGDGKLIRPLQDMLNDLYDQIRKAARPNRIFVDPNSDAELGDDWDETDDPIPCIDPNTNIRVVEVGNVNPALWQLLNMVHMEIQRVTRFSELMLGQSSKAKTATEAAIQQQQGNSATDYKKLLLQNTLMEVCRYAFDLMLENYDAGKWYRICEEDGTDNFEWIDFQQMNTVPILKPASDGYLNEFRQGNPDTEMPEWEQLTSESGTGMTKSVELDVEISIGAGLPKNKAFLYQMLEALATMVVEGKNVVTWEEFRRFVKEYLGIPLGPNPQTMLPPEAMMGQPQPGMPQPGQPPSNYDLQGLSAGGNPQMRNLPGTTQGGLLG